MMTSSFSWQWARVDDPFATSSRATLIFSPCVTVRRYSSVTASGCIEFQSYTCIGSTSSLHQSASVSAARHKLGRRLRRLFRIPVRPNPHRVQERHKLTQSSSHLLDGMRLLTLACGVEPWSSGFVFRDPLAGVFAALNITQHAAHGLPSLISDQLRSAGVIAVFSSIADGVPHVVQSAAVHQIHNQLQFMHALEVCDLWLVSRFDQGFEAGFYQRAHTAAKNSLLAEEISFGFFAESRLDDTGSR